MKGSANAWCKLVANMMVTNPGLDYLEVIAKIRMFIVASRCCFGCDRSVSDYWGLTGFRLQNEEVEVFSVLARQLSIRTLVPAEWDRTTGEMGLDHLFTFSNTYDYFDNLLECSMV